MTTPLLRHRVTLQSRDNFKDGFGQQSAPWRDFLTVWADIQPASGNEQAAGEALNAVVTHTVRIRYRPGVTAAMRALYRGTVYDIKSVIDDDMRHKWLVMLCTEGLNEGG